MVKRYASHRKPLYKDAPWWEKNKPQVLVALCTISMIGIFGPWLYDILRTPRSGMLAEFNPRSDEDVRRLRRKIRSRENELADSPYGKY